jgi:hypothetical protein
MEKFTLLGVGTALTLATNCASAGSPALLWDQNSNFGGTVFSENSDAAADDFAVPSGQTWRVSQIDVTGAYFNGYGPASSETVTFYNDKNGKPGRIHSGPFTLTCADSGGSFHCILPAAVKLRPGTWWVSVVANCNFENCGQWGWTLNTVVQGNEAVWRNGEGSGKCATFKPLHRCFGGAPADLAFKLYGSSK